MRHRSLEEKQIKSIEALERAQDTIKYYQDMEVWLIRNLQLIEEIQEEKHRLSKLVEGAGDQSKVEEQIQTRIEELEEELDNMYIDIICI